MIFVVIVVIVGVVALAVWLAGPPVIGKTLKASEDRLERMRHSDAALHYRVPHGQDPAVLTSALTEAGYEAVGDLVEGRPVVMIEDRRGGAPDRDKVRAVIEQASASTLEGGAVQERPVVFEEERSSG
ncbi:MAG: hypothetical protein ACTHKG_07880 [Nocardioides sp.]